MKKNPFRSVRKAASFSGRMALTVAVLSAAGIAQAHDPVAEADIGYDAAMAQAAAGDTKTAALGLQKLAIDPTVERSVRRSAAYNAACFFSLLEASQSEALSMLSLAAKLGFMDAGQLAKDTDLDSIRSDPQFAEIMASVERNAEAEARRWSGAAFATSYRENLPVEERLAGLSLVWSEVKYNFANFDLVADLDWDAAYMETIPQVVAAQDTYAYYLVLQKFVARLQDGHSNVYFPRDDAFVGGGSYAIKPTTKWVDGKLLLDFVAGDEFQQQGVTRGDEIIAVDGEPIQAFADRTRRPFVSGSTKASVDSQVYSWRLWSGPQGPISFTIAKPDGEVVEVQSSRPNWDEFFELRGDVGQLPPNFRWKMLPNQIAYVELNTFSNPDVVKQWRDQFSEISKAQGIIFDVRRNGGGSSGFGYDILASLTSERFAVSSWRTLEYRPAFRAWGNPVEYHTSDGNYRMPDKDRQFAGPVAVLAGVDTFSAAEDFLVAFDAMDRGPIIGTPSGGSTGQPLYIALPGGGSARVTTKRDTYPDGSDFVGVGVQPAIEVRQTAEDFRSDYDPTLACAVKAIGSALATGNALPTTNPCLDQ